MKKFIRMTALALAALLMLAGCGKKQETTGDRLAQIQQKGELVIAMEGTSRRPPHPYLRPAAEGHMDEWRRILEGELENGG